MIEAVMKRYPTLCDVAGHRRLQEDLEAALVACKGSPDGRPLWDAYAKRPWTANELTFYLCADIVSTFGVRVADELEQQLRTLVAGLSIDEVRRAYHDKLIAKVTTQFEDVRYEIAAAAGALSFFDPGTMKLEPEIGAEAKNSDIRGLRQGQAMRLEVRVIHDEWPPRAHGNTQEIAESAEIDAGYAATLRFPVDDEGARRVKHLVESLHAADLTSNHSETEPLKIEGFDFWFDGGEYHSTDKDCPIDSISFEEIKDLRTVQFPCFTRATVDPQEMGLFKKQPGVITMADLPTDARTHERRPISTKIGQAVQSKARQCEAGIPNLVVLGTPNVMIDHDVSDALYGVLHAVYQKKADGSFTEGQGVRIASGMFTPRANSQCPENLVEPYTVISGVWHVRLGSHPHSQVLPNPNAAMPIDKATLGVLAATLPNV